MPGGHGYGQSGLFLGIRPGNVNNYGPAGQDPDERQQRLRAYLAQLNQMRSQGQGRYTPQRGGAQPYQPGMATGTVAAAGTPISATGDAISDWNQAALAATAEPDDGIEYEPGFQAPSRHWFARRGGRAKLRPGDQLTVGEEGPETMVVDQPTNATVIPGFGPETEQAAATAADQAVAAMGQRSSRRYERAGRIRSFQDEHMQGATAGSDIASDEFDQIKRGEIRPDEARHPAARRAGMALYESGANPIRDARVRAAQPAPGVIMAANERLATRRRVGETDDQFKARMQQLPLAEASPEFQDEVGSQAYIPTKAERDATMTEEQRSARESARQRRESRTKQVNDLLRERSLERREAVERFGTSRPRAVGALRQEKRQREDMLTLAGLQAETAVAAAAAKGGGGEESKRRATYIANRTRDGITTAEEASKEYDTFVDPAPAAAPGSTSPSAPEWDPSIWQATADAPSSASVTGLWRRIWGDQSDTEREFEGRIGTFENRIGELENHATLTPDQKKRAAQAILAQMPQGWLTEFAGKFGDRKRALHNRLLKLAFGQEGRGESKRVASKVGPSSRGAAGGGFVTRAQ